MFLTSRLTVFALLAVTSAAPIFAGGCAHAQTQPLPAKAPTIAAFDKPFLFAYSDWNKKNSVIQNGVLTIQTKSGKGGLGDNAQLDLSGQTELLPVLKLQIGAANKGKQLSLMLKDGKEGASSWRFALDGLPVGETVTAYPEGGASLGNPNKIDDKGAADLSAIVQWQVQGNWSADPFDVQIETIYLAPPTPAMIAARAEQERKAAEDAEKLRLAKIEALKNIRHTPDSPKIEAVYLAAPDIIGIRIQEGVLKTFPRVSYVPQEGDTIRRDGKDVLAWKDGEIVTEKAGRDLMRVVGKRKMQVGSIGGGRDGKLWFLPAEERLGDSLQQLTVDDATSYRINGATPVAVYRKNKPNNTVKPSNEKLIEFNIYLKLAEPLALGKPVNIEFPGVNTDKASVSFTPDARSWSESVHASQVGYRPDDPFKRAFYSLWLGTGGAYSLPNPPAFSLVDASGKAVFKGQGQLAMAADGTEQLRVKKNYAGTAVYALDFSEFKTPGTYRVCVDGIGCSYPFEIGADVWEKAWKVSMNGLLVHRSGLALEKPWSDMTRGRDFHPADGVKVFQTTANRMIVGNGSHDAFDALVKGRTDEVLEGAWGGYHDAGDFDRAALHLWRSTYLPLELMDLFPAYFAKEKLSLPPSEATDNIPDILNEAMWNVDLFRRTQKADGGIIGGIESSNHPRSGETSDIDSLVALAYAPDAKSSYQYAATTSRLARLLAPFDAAKAKDYGASALRAFDYADRNRAAQSATLKDGDKRNLSAVRATAAVELLRQTGDARFDSIFRAEHPVAQNKPLGDVEWQDSAFAYARLPENLGDAAVKKGIVDAFRARADVAVEFGAGNSFGITTDIPGLPEIGFVGYWSVPGIIDQVVPRAHYLTKDDKYLAATVRSANYSGGANPDNMTYTTGLGVKSPLAPLHIDSRASGQKPPAGITVYGQSDPARGGAPGWVYAFHLNDKTTTPYARKWPGSEAYVDFYVWPEMNEYTVHQTIGPSAYVRGYLAARP